MNTFNQILSVIGCAAAFLVFFLFLFFITRKKKNNKNAEYDERQIAARGKAFRAGFFSMMLYFAWFMVVSTFEFELISRYNVYIIFAGIVFGIGVFAVMAIKNDAYLKLNTKVGTQLKVMVLITVVNIASGIVNYVYGDAKSGAFLMNALCALLSIVILAAILIHQKKISGNEEDAE